MVSLGRGRKHEFPFEFSTNAPMNLVDDEEFFEFDGRCWKRAVVESEKGPLSPSSHMTAAE